MQTIYLDISNKGVIPCIQAKQSEVGRKFLAVITDNGIPYNIPTDSLLSVWYEGDTDAGNYSSIDEKSAFSIDGNKISVELVAQMLLKPGNGELCLSITHGDGGETNTWNIPYCVEYKPGAGSYVPTEYYTALTEAGATAAKFATDAEKSAKQAEEAVNGYVKIADLSEYLLAYEQKKVPVGYTFHWSPVDGSGVDLSTAENVHNHFGFGVWEQIKDRFLLSAGDAFSVSENGGNKTHKITTNEMPSHYHRERLRVYGGTSWLEYTTDDNGIWFDYSNKNGAAKYVTPGSVKTSAVVSAFVNTDATGGNTPMDIMPPYFSVYTWKRIA